MNPIIQSLHARKSVRAYEDKPVAPETLSSILEAAVQAPTAGNQQLYTILHITDPGVKARLAVLADNQPFIASAPVVLVFLADCDRWLQIYRASGVQARQPGEGDLMLSVTDACIAAQNAVVAADSLGLGSCYIGDIMENCDDVRKLLSLPAYTFPCAMLVMGYPTKQQRERKKPARVALKHVVHENAYRPLPPDELRAMLIDRAERDDRASFNFDRDVQTFCKRKYESDFSREMTRSVAQYIEAFRD